MQSFADSADGDRSRTSFTCASSGIGVGVKFAQLAMIPFGATLRSPFINNDCKDEQRGISSLTECDTERPGRRQRGGRRKGKKQRERRDDRHGSSNGNNWRREGSLGNIAEKNQQSVPVAMNIVQTGSDINKEQEIEELPGVILQEPESAKMPEAIDERLQDNPLWYEPESKVTETVTNKELVFRLQQLHHCVQSLVNNETPTVRWRDYKFLLEDLQELLELFLMTEMQFVQLVNLENRFFKIMYYPIIKQMRKQLSELKYPVTNPMYPVYLRDLMCIIKNAIAFFEQLLSKLEHRYRFELQHYLGPNAATNSKEPQNALALISAQAIFLILGDLMCCQQEIQETQNWRKIIKTYEKAQQVLPDNGLTYYKLAQASVRAKSKIEVLYFYVRSLMSSNPFKTGDAKLMNFLHQEMVRQNKAPIRQSYAEILRREKLIHPDESDPLVGLGVVNDDEKLSLQVAIKLNRRFNMNFTQVLYQLLTKTDMETFVQVAVQMLRDFRSLIQHDPVVLPTYRLLQLMAINMYTIEKAECKDKCTIDEKCIVLKRSIEIGLLMFGIVLERFVNEIQEKNSQVTLDSFSKLTLTEDAKVLLPAIKIWCDWMSHHTDLWYPPLDCSPYAITTTTNHDPRIGFATLMTKLSYLNISRGYFSTVNREGTIMVRLQEDIFLAGFTPLKYDIVPPVYINRDQDSEKAQNAFRIYKIIFFGLECLCQCYPPVLREIVNTEDARRQFISTANGHAERATDEQYGNEQKEPDVDKTNCKRNGSRRNRTKSTSKQLVQENHTLRMQSLVTQCANTPNVMARPHIIVPDTNCFIDYLSEIMTIANTFPLYQLLIPVVVLNELEGLRIGQPQVRYRIKDISAKIQINMAPSPDARHNRNRVPCSSRVAKGSQEALNFIYSKNPAIGCATSMGSIIRVCPYKEKDDADGPKNNDDRILHTALNLRYPKGETKAGTEDRTVVLLTGDRSMYEKALAIDVPVCTVTEFIKWVGLAPLPGHNQ